MKTECKSCVGCKFLYQQGYGYSNWTWDGSYAQCAKNKNPNLGVDADVPYDWKNESPEVDNWPRTNTSRCDLYQAGPYVGLDVDGEDGPANYTNDEEQIEAICKHSQRGRNGGTL